MVHDHLLWTLLGSFVSWLPWLLVLPAIALASLAVARRHPVVTVLVWLGVALLLVRVGLSIVSPSAVSAYLSLSPSPRYDLVPWFYGAQSVVRGGLSAVGYALLAAATFVGRPRPDPLGEAPRGP